MGLRRALTGATLHHITRSPMQFQPQSQAGLEGEQLVLTDKLQEHTKNVQLYALSQNEVRDNSDMFIRHYSTYYHDAVQDT